MYQFFDTVTDFSGNGLVGAQVQVFVYPSSGALTLATIYQSNGTTQPIANSTMVADATGQVSCFLPDGVYSFVYSYQATVLKTRGPEQILDPMGFIAVTDTGSTNALNVQDQRLPAQLLAGQKLEVLVKATNAGATALFFQGDGGHQVVVPGGSALSPGILQANGLTRMEFDGTNWQLVGAQGQPYYAPIAAESGITIVNNTWPPGTIDRYGNNVAQGSTDMTQAAKNAFTVHLASGYPFTGLSEVYKVTDTICAMTTATPNVVLRGTPFRTRINNQASANKPTFKATDCQYFDVAGFVLTGAAGFPNEGFFIGSAGGQRSGFAQIRDLICCTNSFSATAGLHMQACNTIDILNYMYWPSGNGFGGTIDTNGQPHGILMDGTTAVNGISMRNLNIGGVNSIANGGSAILIDGTASNAPFQAIKIDTLEAEQTGTRSLHVRNGNVVVLSNLFVENTEVRFDNNCVRVQTEGLEGAASATVVVDGTQPLGGCIGMQWKNCQAGSFTADSANTESFHDTCSYPNTFTENTQNAKWINTRGVGSVLLVDRIQSRYAFKANGTGRASTTTLADDPDLIFTGLPKGTYRFKGMLQFFGTTTGTQGFKFALRIGGGITGSNWIIPKGIVNGSFSQPNVITPVTTVDNFATIGTGTADALEFDGIVTTNGTGDIAVQWAQNSSSANNTNLNGGSYFEITRVG